MYEVEEYCTEAGECPFDEWLEELRDIRAQKKILGRIARVRCGNLGDWKSLENAQGVFEIREHFWTRISHLFWLCWKDNHSIAGRLRQKRSRQSNCESQAVLG